MDSLALFHKGLDEADVANENGEFVSFYGMEFGVISTGGHVVIYDIDSLIGWESSNYDIYNAEGDYTSLFDIVNDKGGAFAYLAHPEDDQYDSLFHKAHRPAFDSAIIGMANCSGPAFSEDTTYSDPGACDHYARYKDLLGKDYHAAPGVDHDNHYNTFGKHTPARTVVLADTLTRPKILDAFRDSRFYAAEDRNVEIEFTCNGSYMGSKLEENSDPSFDIVVHDPDDSDTTEYIRLKHLVPGSGNNPTSVATSNDDSTLSYTHNINDGDEYYYYAEIRQVDDQMTYTAPIRFTKNTTLPVELTEFTASGGRNLNVELEWSTASEENSDHFRVERSRDGEKYRKIGEVEAAGNSSEEKKYNFPHQEEKPGTHYYRLVQVDRNGESDTSAPESVELKDRHPFQILHANGDLQKGVRVVLDSQEDRKVKVQLFNMMGQEEIRNQEDLVPGKNKLELPFIPDSPGIYWIRITDLEQGRRRSRKLPIIEP